MASPETVRERGGGAEATTREVLLETVLSATALGVLVADDEGGIVFANEVGRQLFADGAPVVGRLLAEVVAAGPWSVREAMERAGDGLVTLDHRTQPETYQLSRRHFGLHGRENLLVMLRPLTRELGRKEAEVWKRAIRVISHELNNSLTPVTSLVHTARLVVQDPEHRHRLDTMLATIAERTAHVRAFLDAYSQFARLPPPRLAAASWAAVLEPLAPLYRFTVVGTPPPEEGRFDAAQIQQVLINLLKNAHEAGGSPDEVALSIRRAEGVGTEIIVLDRGKGMSPDELRQATLPFYSTKKTGLGLGLAVSREIIEAHGGALSIKSREGGGIAARCWLPDALGESAPQG